MARHVVGVEEAGTPLGDDEDIILPRLGVYLNLPPVFELFWLEPEEHFHPELCRFGGELFGKIPRSEQGTDLRRFVSHRGLFKDVLSILPYQLEERRSGHLVQTQPSFGPVHALHLGFFSSCLRISGGGTCASRVASPPRPVPRG